MMFTTSILCVALVMILSVQASNYYDRPLIKDYKNSKSVPVNTLPVTFYTEGQKSAQTDTTGYFVLEQCEISTAERKYATLNIICPDNPTFNTSKPYVVIELSNCKDSWNASCLFATNYVWDTQNPTIYTNISWIYSAQSDYVYVRYRSYIRDISITLLLSYTDYATENVGTYTAGVIPGTIATNVNYEQLLQYVKSSRTSTVQTNDMVVFFFSLCTRDWPGTGDYSITASVVSDISHPLSAFDLVGCAYSEFPDPDDCSVSNLQAVKDQDAAPLVDIVMHNDEQTDLTQGVYLTIYGEGGEPDGLNVFFIDVTVTLDN